MDYSQGYSQDQLSSANTVKVQTWLKPLQRGLILKFWVDQYQQICPSCNPGPIWYWNKENSPIRCLGLRKSQKAQEAWKDEVARQISRQYLKVSTKRMLSRRLKQEFWQAAHPADKVSIIRQRCWQNYTKTPRISKTPKLLTTHLATAKSTWGSCSHFFRASTLLVFLWGLASRKTASDHRIPEIQKQKSALQPYFWLQKCTLFLRLPQKEYTDTNHKGLKYPPTQ